ncbi:MAG TPA: hypothetical protein VIQ31_02870 [Phormidium sp.]
MFEKIDRSWLADILSRFQWFRKIYKGYWQKLELTCLSGKVRYQWVSHIWKTTHKEKLGTVVETERYRYDWELK